MLADISQRLTFPPEIASTNLRPDMVLWSPSLKVVNIIELTVPWEKMKGRSSATQNWQQTRNSMGGVTKSILSKWDCKGFVAFSTIKHLRELGSHKQELRQTIKALSEGEPLENPVETPLEGVYVLCAQPSMTQGKGLPAIHSPLG